MRESAKRFVASAIGSICGAVVVLLLAPELVYLGMFTGACAGFAFYEFKSFLSSASNVLSELLEAGSRVKSSIVEYVLPSPFFFWMVSVTVVGSPLISYFALRDSGETGLQYVASFLTFFLATAVGFWALFLAAGITTDNVMASFYGDKVDLMFAPEKAQKRHYVIAPFALVLALLLDIVLLMVAIVSVVFWFPVAVLARVYSRARLACAFSSAIGIGLAVWCLDGAQYDSAKYGIFLATAAAFGGITGIVVHQIENRIDSALHRVLKPPTLYITWFGKHFSEYLRTAFLG